MSAPNTYRYEILNGSAVCCGNNDDPELKNRCPRCAGKVVNAHRLTTLRTAIPHEFTPPNPYSAGLAAMRQGLPVLPVMRESPCPFEDKNYKPGDGSAPDPYKIALQRQKEKK